MMSKSQRSEFVVPEEAARRGQIISGELKSKHHRFPAMLVQFSKLVPHSRKARIYLYPTVEQAKRLYAISGPFTFEGSSTPQDGMIEFHHATDIWLDCGSQMFSHEAICWTQPSGRIGSLTTKITYSEGPELHRRADAPQAWLVVGRCVALQIMSNADEEESRDAARFGITRMDISLTLSNDSQATVQRYMRYHRLGAGREVKGNGYAVLVRDIADAATAKRDVDALLILASFASRERTINAYWSSETKADWTRTWRFNFAKFPRRPRPENSLVVGSREEFLDFLQRAFTVYSAARHRRSSIPLFSPYWTGNRRLNSELLTFSREFRGH